MKMFRRPRHRFYLREIAVAEELHAQWPQFFPPAKNPGPVRFEGVLAEKPRSRRRGKKPRRFRQ